LVLSMTKAPVKRTNRPHTQTISMERGAVGIGVSWPSHEPGVLVAKQRNNWKATSDFRQGGNCRGKKNPSRGKRTTKKKIERGGHVKNGKTIH